jgi:hypothetical protein
MMAKETMRIGMILKMTILQVDESEVLNHFVMHWSTNLVRRSESAG